MIRNPYASPKAPVDTGKGGELPEWRRAKLLWSLAAAITAVPCVAIEVLRPPVVVEPLAMLCAWLGASVLGWLIASDIWRLRVQRRPLWEEIVAVIVGVGVVSVMIWLHASGILVWNMIYVGFFGGWLAALIAIVAWVTEAKKGVRVYYDGRTLVFIHQERKSI